MPVTMPPKSALGKPKTEAEIEAIINKGGSPMFDVSRAPSDHDGDKPKAVNLRLTVGVLNRIDTQREKRPRKLASPKKGISQQDWLVEAVLEKLQREESQ